MSKHNDKGAMLLIPKTRKHNIAKVGTRRRPPLTKKGPTPAVHSSGTTVPKIRTPDPGDKSERVSESV